MPDQHLSAWATGRWAVGLAYGMLLALIYSVLARTVDVMIMRDVPLAVNWPQAIVFIITTTLSGAVLGVVVAWPHEAWKGVLAGAVAIAVWGLLRAVTSIAALSFIFVPTILPLIFLGTPIAGLLRLVLGLHDKIHGQRGPARWRNFALLVVGVAALAAFAGSWSQMPAYAQEAVRKVDRVIQFVRQNPDKPLSVTLRDVPEIRDHVHLSYVLTQTAITSSATGVEVDAVFADGFAISCLIGQEGDIPYCQKGRNVFSNPGG